LGAIVCLAHLISDLSYLFEQGQLRTGRESRQGLAQITEMCANVDHPIVDLGEVLLLASYPAGKFGQTLLQFLGLAATLPD